MQTQEELILTKEIVYGIPVLECFNRDGLRKPLVLLSHGFNENKDRWMPYLKTLAEYGYYAIALDNHNHGERMERDFYSQVFSGSKLKLHEVRRLIKETAEDVSCLIDYFIASTEIDQNRIGMSGISMGGFTTFRALIIEKRIKVAAPIISSPYWDDIPQEVPVADNSESREALASISREYSPALFPEQFFPRPLLIQIGDQDTHYDPNRVRQFYKQLMSNYYKEDPQRLKLIIHKGVGHEFNSSMWVNVMGWFEKYL
jgi:dienelactone hydrolase